MESRNITPGEHNTADYREEQRERNRQLLWATSGPFAELKDNPGAIAYEDPHLLVLVKPAGMLVHPTVREDGYTLYNYVQRYYEDCGLELGLHPVSRLDRNTSGLVIFAKYPAVQARFARQEIGKEYLALVTGTLPERHGVIDAPIARKPGSIIERCVSPEGKEARTGYTVLSHHDDITLVRAVLHTGRTHQIRVHFAHLGCPLWHDNLYGNPGPQLRHGLHAWKLAFRHPVTGKKLVITSALPPDLRQVLGRK